jgi:hypothetical protein
VLKNAAAVVVGLEGSATAQRVARHAAEPAPHQRR